jgi:hypothetical protein
MTAAARTSTAKEQQNRAFWLKHLHQWHWMSAALCLIGLVLFSITGFTLNHAGWIGANPQVTSFTEQLPQSLLQELQSASKTGTQRELPTAMRRWLDQRFSVSSGQSVPEWSDVEVYVSLPRPGGDGWLSVDLENGDVLFEESDRGWLAYFNDLHKGRSAGAAWSWFIDAFAVATLVFASTGLLLLKMHSTHRPGTWPMVGLGLVLPLLLALLFVH